MKKLTVLFLILVSSQVFAEGEMTTQEVECSRISSATSAEASVLVDAEKPASSAKSKGL